MEGEGSLVLCADVIAIKTVDGADDDALTVFPGANPVGSDVGKSRSEKEKTQKGQSQSSREG
jgi:hypothetical protein